MKNYILLALSLIIFINCSGQTKKQKGSPVKNDVVSTVTTLPPPTLSQLIKRCLEKDYRVCTDLGGNAYQRNNIPLAIKMYKKACDGSFYEGCILWGHIEKKNGNLTEAKRLFKIGCDAGDLESCRLLSEKNEAMNVKKSSPALKIGILTDNESSDDLAFYKSGWQGALKAENVLGIKPIFQEATGEKSYVSNLRHLQLKGADYIIGFTYKVAEAILSEAKRNPQQKYIIIDHPSDLPLPPNVMIMVTKDEESAFLAGFVAAKVSASNKVGFIGGMLFPPIQAFQYGFKSGAQYANKSIDVMEVYSGTFIDKAKGKTLAKEMYGKNVDVIYHAAAVTGLGVIEAALEEKKYAIGADVDQKGLAPENVLTSSLKRVDNLVFHTIDQLEKGKFFGGSQIYVGLEHGAVDIAPILSSVKINNLENDVNRLKEAIAKKTLIVPNNANTYLGFLKTLK